MQARLTAAQMRQEAQRREEESKRKEEEEVKEKKRKRQAASQPEEVKAPVRANAPPPAEAQVNDDLIDEWTIVGKRVIRHFRTPRLVTFTPFNASCPVDPNKLKAKRITHCIGVETGEIIECEDDWKRVVIHILTSLGQVKN